MRIDIKGVITTFRRWRSVEIMPHVLYVTIRVFCVAHVCRSLCLVSSLVPAERLLAPTKVQLHSFNAGQSRAGRGIQTMVDRSPGQLLLRIPVNETITARNSLSPQVADRPDLTAEQKLAVALLTLKSKNHPYVSEVLPQHQHYYIWTFPQEAWEAKPFTLLPRCYRQSFQATRDHVHQFVEKMNKEEIYCNYSVDDWQWAFSMVRSRSVAVPELASEDTRKKESVQLALIPGLDLCNHQFGAGTELQLTNDDYWTLCSSHPYAAGDQIFLSYGDDKDNLKLFLTYGFVVDDNPNTLAFWSWQDLLEVAISIRPGMFSERIRQSLLNHPQLKQYVVPSESKATFSYDLKQRAPRESLQNGLTMLSSLATQLGFPDDTALPQDALDGLIQTRISDLNAILEDFRRPEGLSDEWEPFVQSMRTILQQELELLVEM